jgi:hypothetical protein
MKVFAERYLEEMKFTETPPTSEWDWNPVDVNHIYASGANTNTSSSTYAAEKDNRSDSDRPNEGRASEMMVA